MPLEQQEASSMDIASGIRSPNTIPAWSDRSNLNRLCLRCSKISWSSLQPTDNRYWATLRVSREPLRLGTLRESAHAGCHLCCLVLAQLEAEFLEEDDNRKSRTIRYGPESGPTYGDEAEIEIEGYFPNEYCCGQPPTTMFVSLNPTQVEENNVRVVKSELRTGFSIKALGLHRSLSTRASLGADNSTNLDHAESVARYWLKDCLESHEICAAQHKQSPNLPLRIIEIEGDESCLTARLLITDGQPARYVALSHRWGVEPTWKTTTKNLGPRQVAINLTSLSLTVQAAIKLTHALDIRFLWIDSICILQDDDEDWQRQSSNMTNIYRNAVLTIAACGKYDADDSCAPSRDILTSLDCQIAPSVVVSRQRMISKIDFGLLSDRGWTFQEQHLSPRILCFGGFYMAWRCCSGSRYDPNSSNFEERGTGLLPDLQPIQDELYPDLRMGLNNWYDMVREYSKRIITFPSDRLPALSGMALHYGTLLHRALSQIQTPDAQAALRRKELSDIYGDYFTQLDCIEYICGLWTFDIIRGLGWYVKHWNKSEPGPYRAPSWSWAAVYSEIWYPAFIGFPHNFWDEYRRGERLLPFDDASYVTTLSVRVKIVGANPFGAVDSGKITVLGPITPWMYVMLVDRDTFRKHFALHFDNSQAASINSVFLRLTRENCLILEAVSKPGCSGTYRRVGLVNQPLLSDESCDEWNKYMDNVFDWTETIVSII